MIADSLWIQLGRSLGKQFVLACAGRAKKGFEVIDNLALQGIKLVLVLSDWIMPKLQGYEFLSRVRAKHPSIQAIVSSKQAVHIILSSILQEDIIAQYLPKPWDEQELISTILSLS